MKLGCFGKISHMEAVERAGFDAIELDFCELVALSEEAWRRFYLLAQKSSLTFEVLSGLLPPDIRIYEECFDALRWLLHIRRGCERAAKLGTRLIPFGAGKSRSIPGGCQNRRACEEKLEGFVGQICDIFSDYGMTLVIEPLGPAYSNYLNTLDEAKDLALRTGRKNCKIMCDLRHMVKSGESFGEILRYKDDILHAHIDYPEGEQRFFPRTHDGYDYMPYLSALGASGYKGILTIEATQYRNFYAEALEGRSCLEKLLNFNRK